MSLQVEGSSVEKRPRLRCRVVFPESSLETSRWPSVRCRGVVLEAGLAAKGKPLGKPELPRSDLPIGGPEGDTPCGGLRLFRPYCEQLLPTVRRGQRLRSTKHLLHQPCQKQTAPVQFGGTLLPHYIQKHLGRDQGRKIRATSSSGDLSVSRLPAGPRGRWAVDGG